MRQRNGDGQITCMVQKTRTVPALIDVARRAGVGAATVSRVINGGQNVSKKTLAAVQAAIQELGYHPSQAARSLKGARTRTIGLIVPSVADPFFSTAAAAIQDVARTHDTLVLLASSDNQSKREHELVTSFIQRRVDGLILAPSDHADTNLLKHAGFPVVCFDRPLPGHAAGTVLSDNAAGARLATSHLVRLGYKRILCMGGDPRLFTSRRRVQGFKTVIGRSGLPFLAELNVQDYATAQAALEPYLRGRNRIDAIFSIKNAVTVHAYQILRRAALDIPKDVALIGYDDFLLADVLEPPISVVRQPVEQIAMRAAENLFAALESGETSTAEIVLPVELVTRSSCGEAMRRSKQKTRR